MILLGFVKYFWRDTITRLKSDIRKKEVADRLSSLNVEGLRISSLRGDTLVDYSGSLTGRDFRAIAQAAPFVLHGFVTDASYDVWLSLSFMVALVWMHQIEDIEKYAVSILFLIPNFCGTKI